MTHKHIFEHAKIVACRRNRFGSRRQNIRVDAKKKNLMVKKSDKIVKDQRSYESRKQVAHK